MFAILPKLRAILKPALFSLLILAIGGGLPSCKKEKTCDAIVTVQDTSGAPMQGATVKVFAGQVEQTGTTDGVGQAEFKFDNPAILDIIALHTTYAGDTAKGILKLEEGEKVRKTVQF